MARPVEQTKLRYFIGYDVEATGQCMKNNFMCRFGASLVEIKTGKQLSRFSTFCKPPSDKHGWEQRCLDEFWFKPDIKPLYDEIVAALPTAPTLAQAGNLFVSWINKQITEYGGESLMFVSDTAGFDYAWLSTALPGGMSLLYLFG